MIILCCMCNIIFELDKDIVLLVLYLENIQNEQQKKC